MAEQEDNVFSGSAIGSRLKGARESANLSLEDVAGRTRIPTRHLTAIENGDWDALPAATYTVGFARNYATVVGLNPTEIGSAIRAELGDRARPAIAPIYEPADPARVPPRGIVLFAGAVAIVLAVGYGIWRTSSFEDNGDAEVASVSAPAGPAPNAAGPAAAPAAAPSANGPVVLTATNDVWLRVYEANGGARLYENTLKAGERYEVPATAAAPQILTGRPDALKVTVGATPIPQLGPAERTISDVSLKPADLIARTSAAPALPGAPAAGATPGP